MSYAWWCAHPLLRKAEVFLEKTLCSVFINSGLGEFLIPCIIEDLRTCYKIHFLSLLCFHGHTHIYTHTQICIHTYIKYILYTHISCGCVYICVMFFYFIFYLIWVLICINRKILSLNFMDKTKFYKQASYCLFTTT